MSADAADLQAERAFSCYVIGRGAVAARCLEKLASAGAEVRGVFSADRSLAALAENRGWPHLEDRESCHRALSADAYDHLFSIDNGWILPADVLVTPRRSVINFHDGPLPAYAGLHAPTWALLNGETEHGITWHEVDGGIDTGAILEQRRIAVDDRDTSFTLNARCFDAGIVGFDALLARLMTRTVMPIPQSASGRSYFGRRDRPSAAGVVSFAQPAEAVDRLVRALDFGPTRNPFAVAKVLVGAEYLCPTRSAIHEDVAIVPPLTDRGVAQPGDVVSIEGSRVRIGTATGEVILWGWRTLQGEALADDDVAARFASLPCGRLSEPDDGERLRLGEADEQASRHEAFFVRALTDLRPMAHPYASPESAVQRVPLGLPGAVELGMVARAHRDWIVAVLAAYALRIADRSSGDVGLQTERLPVDVAAAFDAVLPLRIGFEPRQGFDTFAAAVVASLDAFAGRRLFAADLIAREPTLRALGPVELPVVIRLEGASSGVRTSQTQARRATFTFVVFADGSEPAMEIGSGMAVWQVDAIRSQISHLAAALLDDPAGVVAELPLLSATERDRIVHGWNATTEPVPPSTIHALIWAEADRTPNAPAVRFGDRSITYRDLMRRAERVATQLRAAGVGRGDVVAVSLPRSADVVVALLGVLHAGAAYLPIDPTSPPGRIAAMVRDGGTRTVVTNRSLRKSLFSSGPSSPSAVLLPEDDATAGDGPFADTFEPGDPDDLAYVIFTSGSTGTPKGVEIAHRGLVNHGLAIARNYGLGPGDRLLCSASIGFDVAGEQIYPALLCGAEVVVRPEDLFDSFPRFDAFLREQTISAVVLPTAFWHEWVRHLDRTATMPPTTLRSVSTGTEKVLASHLASWRAMTGDRIRFFQGYGPTETTITCTMYALGAEGLDVGRDVPIGLPLPNTVVRILDAGMQPVPVGVVGELYVGGVGLARGYRNDPRLTSERFVADPFLPGGRLYRTGDRGRYEPDGQIVYAGRGDAQIKIRGHRIELGEIESVLRAVPGVDEAVVVVDEQAGQKRLLAYIVTPLEVDARLIDGQLRAQLPDPMVPAAVLQLRSLPKTANQKVDRAALPRPASPGSGRRAPATATEARVLALWAASLQREPDGISTTMSYFDLGGDSLGAVALLSHVEHVFGRPVLLSEFVRAPTIAALAAAIDDPSLPADGGGGSVAVAEAERLVVVIRPGDPGRRPLWLIHPVGGHVLFGNHLRASMDPSQPLFGIQARGLDGRVDPHPSLDAMAEHYTALIRAAQPDGPYGIAGPSMGGYIAIEIARRLERAGQRVDLLALLDSWAPGFPRSTSVLLRLRDNAAVLAALPNWSARARELRKRWGGGTGGSPPIEPLHYDAIERLRSRLDVLGISAVSDRPNASDSPTPTAIATIERVTLANEAANRMHAVVAFDTPLLLLRADRRTQWSGMRFDDPNNGWLPFARGGMRAMGFDCDHAELADAPGPAVGRALQAALDELRAPTEQWPKVAAASVPGGPPR